jgi:hypothetical protein
LQELGVLYPNAGKVEAICRNLLRVNLVGEQSRFRKPPETADVRDFKGPSALFLEISALAERAGMLDEFLQSCDQFYPALMKIVERNLTTYPSPCSPPRR